VVPDLLTIFERAAQFDPQADLETFLAGVPGRWVVYLMAGEQDEPIQLLCVRNLRASLRRRLSGDEQVGPTRRVNYRQIVRRVYWQRVDSAFEADLAYLEAARALFPESYQGMVGFRPAWFVHVDPDAPFPRYVKTHDLRPRPGVFLGPIEDKHAAQRLIELIESAFDLCRYYNVLLEAPRGRACAYKEMGRCPAPCDGSIPMQQYRETVRRSAEAIADPAPAIAAEQADMRRLAADLRFEQAKRTKERIDQLSSLGKGALRHARALDCFVYLSLQHGPRAGTAKLLLITPSAIAPVGCLLGEPTGAAGSDLLRSVLALAEQREGLSDDPAAAERIGVVSQHLFQAKRRHGAFIPLEDLDERALLRAWRELGKQDRDEAPEAEGLTRELSAL
jgi:hypothetical protein